MYCTACGNPVGEARYCTRCGASQLPPGRFERAAAATLNGLIRLAAHIIAACGRVWYGLKPAALRFWADFAPKAIRLAERLRVQVLRIAARVEARLPAVLAKIERWADAAAEHLRTVVQRVAPASSYCTHCGARLGAAQDFCAACGAKQRGPALA